MRNTENLNLALYDASDKMRITAAENSLNHNMELLDAELAKKMAVPEGGTAGQILTKTQSGFAWQDAPAGSGTGSAVLYTAQTLTSEQQNQARTNIGAAGLDAVIADKEWLPDEMCNVNVLPSLSVSEAGYTYGKSGLSTTDNTGYRALIPMIDVIAGQTYRIEINTTCPGISGLCKWYDASGAYLSDCPEASDALTNDALVTDFVAPEGACYLGLSYGWGADWWTSRFKSLMRITSISDAGEYFLKDLRLTDANLGTAEPFKSVRSRTIVTLGDSIFGYIAGETGVSNLLAGMLGCTVINGAFGGTRAIQRSDDSGYNDLDFTSLVDAIVANDYSAQEAAVTDHSLPAHIQERLAALKTADFSRVDIVTMNYGTNDYTGNFVRDSFITGYKEAIGKLQAAYPQLEVVLITPTYRLWYAEDGSFSEDGDTLVKNGVTLPDVVDAVKEVAQSMHVRCIDAYNIGIGRYNYMNYFGPTDGAHHAENGRRHLARRLARELW